MASLQNGIINGYSKNKGDINRNYVLDPRFECPICLTCLKNTYLTSCGHRFCQDCIFQWLQKRGGCCPIDGKNLSLDKDLFPDNYTRREIAQETMECTFPGCDKVLPLTDIDTHFVEEHVVKAETEERIELSCPFKSIGCKEVFTVQSQLIQHTHRCMNQHLQLLTIAHNKLSHQIPNHNGECKEEEAALWDPPPKQQANEIVVDPSQALIKSLYEKIVILEQKNAEHEVQLKIAREQIAKMLEEKQKYEANLALKLCNGTYIWNLSEMRSKISAFLRDPSLTFYSEGFYTSYSGYKFCARIHVSPDLRFLKLLIHLMKSENDYALSWPFSGRISFTLIHPTQPDLSVCEVMCSKPDSGAFRRPTKTMNTIGFGYSEFIQIDHLTHMRFFNEDGSINIKIQITCI